MDALRNPDKPRPSGECIIGEIARQYVHSPHVSLTILIRSRFSELSMRCASDGARRRFNTKFDMYTAAVVQEARDRAENHIRSIYDYFLLRRHTIGAMPSFAFLHLELELPDRVFEDPVIQRLEKASTEMIILSRGDSHNLVTVVMHHTQLDLKGTMKWIGDYHSRLEKAFLEEMKFVPSFGEKIDVEVRRYVDGLGNWVMANNCWHFESYRYFGTSGLEVQKSRKVVLLPSLR
ncbi:hypothetical protein C0995_016244 [Termitomyces sp. Mi166|nr:hypothetical protein C0995_016244 [Termitomyces sp. Mi166\